MAAPQNYLAVIKVVGIGGGGVERGRIKAKELRILMRRHARVYDVSGVGTAMTRG